MQRYFFTANDFGHLSVYETKDAAQYVADTDVNCFTSVMTKTEACKRYGKSEVEYVLHRHILL